MVGLEEMALWLDVFAGALEVERRKAMMKFDDESVAKAAKEQAAKDKATPGVDFVLELLKTLVFPDLIKRGYDVADDEPTSHELVDGRGRKGRVWVHELHPDLGSVTLKYRMFDSDERATGGMILQSLISAYEALDCETCLPEQLLHVRRGVPQSYTAKNWLG